MNIQSVTFAAAVVGMVASSASAITPHSHPSLPGGCEGACIVKNIDDFLIVDQDKLTVRAPEPGESSGPPDIMF